MNHPGTPNIDWSEDEEAFCKICLGSGNDLEIRFILSNRQDTLFPDGVIEFTGNLIKCPGCSGNKISKCAYDYRNKVIRSIW